MSNNPDSEFPNEMSEYLQMFLDETEEQLEDLIETLLLLERHPNSENELNEAFRLMHSIKGSAGIMGLDNITVLAHQLENRFERFRSRVDQLDQPMMNLVLRCIDFLKQCTARLRAGQAIGSAAELLDELHEHENRATPPMVSAPAVETTGEKKDAAVPVTDDSPETIGRLTVHVHFEPELQLVDLKAQLIASRLAGLGEILNTIPPIAELETITELTEFHVELQTQATEDTIRCAIDLDGVQSVVIDTRPQTPTVNEPQPSESPPASMPMNEADEEFVTHSLVTEMESGAATDSETTPSNVGQQVPQPQPQQRPLEVEPAKTPEKLPTRVAETLRVDIDRLDNLMNLTGELVVNRARFVQLSGLLSPKLKKSTSINRLRDLEGDLAETIAALRQRNSGDGDWRQRIQHLEDGLELVREQVAVMETSRRYFGQITEAIDQLTRVSDKLQRGILETRMVPVGPLFNRFQRVVRDLSVERGKQVRLELRGEKTELDKRMIDELGDPFVHLVRNCVDHGLESTEERLRQGKPEFGTIVLEASQSGHNVCIQIRDDGAGININRIKAKIVERGLLSFVAVDDLSDEELIDYIWHPGFSTAEKITDVSGRGVGMDVVKTRIHDLSGTIEVKSIPQQGTTFTIRLPLTLAIINSLLVRARGVIFSIPISDVREIVALRRTEITSIHGRATFAVRGEFIPLVGMDDVFSWRDDPANDPGNVLQDEFTTDETNSKVPVVILQSSGRSLGLRVHDLLGSQEVVIKSLADNFVSIRGLSGASVLGDGTVCLMLDVASVIDQAVQSARKRLVRKEVPVGSNE